MINRATKLRWRRRLRRQRLQVEEAGVQAEAHLERHFFKRLSRLSLVRRFIVSWILLLCLLIAGSVVQQLALSKYYQDLQPAPGGTYTEGLSGVFTGANPLYATNAADSSVSKLVFAGLMKHNQQNRLVGDLAESIKLDDHGTTYFVTLRPGLKWQDGHTLSAEDVAFTYNTIQNPDARSPLFNSWQGVKVEVKDPRTVSFTLPNQLGAFPYSLTNGIVPKHILEGVSAAQLRTTPFNTVSPIGSGPFKWGTLEVTGSNKDNREEHIGLLPNPYYHGGEPKVNQFIIRTFREEKFMVDAFRQGKLDAMASLPSLPDNLPSSSVIDYSIPLTSEVMIFFNNSAPPFNEVAVRRALVQSVDATQINEVLGYPVIPARQPLLKLHIGYNKDLIQLPYDKAKAEQTLDEAGWLKGPDGMRSKGGQPLQFTLQAQDVSDYAAVCDFVSKSWKEIGVKAEVILQTDSYMQTVVSRHDYQALLYGISLGPDPDVFAYWHSTQAVRGSSWLNLSEYRSSVADKSLEEARTRSDLAVRSAKIKSFLEAWRLDAPALALYQPRFLYVVRGDLFNFDPTIMNGPTDRYSNVENWMVRQEKTLR